MNADRSAGHRRLAVAALALGAVVLAQPGRAPRAQRYVAGPDSLLPRIRYADSLLSLNDRCIVRMSKLNLRVRPVYVSREPVGFC